MARRRRKVKIGRVLFLIFLILLILGLIFMALSKPKDKADIKKPREISKIEGYGYSLREDATEYYKKLFKKLSKVLEDNPDEDEYSSLVSKMFVCDFFTLSNKSSKNDVGGSQFVYSEYKSDFEKYAMDTIYKSVLNNVYGNRKQELPTVKEVKVNKESSTPFKYGEDTDQEAYVYSFEITYEDDYGYQDSGKLTLIHSDKKIEVASMSNE